MAVSSGSFATNSVEGRSVTFSWSIKETSIANNTTTINWSLKSSGSYSGYVSSRKFKVVIDGQQVYYSSADIDLYNNKTIATGTHTIKHNDLGKKSFSASVEGAIYYFAVSAWGNGSWELPDIPRQATIVSAPDFNDEQNPTINYSNPAGESVTSLRACISLDGATDNISYRDISKTGTSYTFNFTDAERTILRNLATSNTKAVIFFIETVIGGTTLRHTMSKTLTIINANPVVGAVTYKDNNAVTVAITENNQRIIRNNSNLLFTLGTATAKKSATIAKYQLTIAGVTQEITTAGDINWGRLNLSSNTTATVKVIDSRGNSASKNVEIIIDDWELPKALISINRKNNFYSETYLKADGIYSSLNGKNTMSIQYQYRKITDKNFSELFNLENNVQTSVELDNNYKWHVIVVVGDRIGETTYNLYVDIGMPIIFFDRELSSVGINCFPQIARTLVSKTPMYTNGGTDVVLGMKTLYESSEGASGTIKLNENSANFNYLEIFYLDNNNANIQSIRVHHPNNKIASLCTIDAGGDNQIHIRTNKYTIVGTDMTFVRGLYGVLGNAKSVLVESQAYIKIIKVVGYR